MRLPRDLISLIQRAKNLIHLRIPNREGVLKYRISVSDTLNNAYGDPTIRGVDTDVGGLGATPLFEVSSGGEYKSRSVRQKRLGYTEEKQGNATRILFDIDDFTDPAPAGGTAPVVDDTKSFFVRVEAFEQVSNSYILQEQILAIPPSDFFNTKSPTYTLFGNAPIYGKPASFANIPAHFPTEMMNIHLPNYTHTISLDHLDDNGNPIFFTTARGCNPGVLMPGKNVTIFGAGVPEIHIASLGNVSEPFSITASIQYLG